MPQPASQPVALRFPPAPWPLHVNFNVDNDRIDGNNTNDRCHNIGDDDDVSRIDQHHDSIRFTLRMMTDSESQTTIRSVRDLLMEYIASLGIDMTFQNVDEELAILPGERYSPQHGGALLLLYACDEDKNGKHPCSCGSTQPSAPAPASHTTFASHTAAFTTPSSTASPPFPSSPSAAPNDPNSCSCYSSHLPLSLIGCVGLKSLGDGISEAKRLFVRPNYRGRDFGRLLLVQAIELAKWIGYHTIRLDTFGRFTAANALYSSLGFVRIPPYNFNPQPDVLYFEIPYLQGRGSQDGSSSSLDDSRTGKEEVFHPRPRWKGVKKMEQREIKRNAVKSSTDVSKAVA